MNGNHVVYSKLFLRIAALTAALVLAGQLADFVFLAGLNSGRASVALVDLLFEEAVVADGFVEKLD